MSNGQDTSLSMTTRVLGSHAQLGILAQGLEFSHVVIMFFCFVPVVSQIAHTESGCPTPGCNGAGHIKGAKFTGHHR